jgi:hypothetical protein
MEKTLKDYMRNLDRIEEIKHQVFRHQIPNSKEYYDYTINAKEKERGKIMLKMEFVNMHTKAPIPFRQPLSEHLNDEVSEDY